MTEKDYAKLDKKSADQVRACLANPSPVCAEYKARIVLLEHALKMAITEIKMSGKDTRGLEIALIGKDE